jgi:cysteine/O-acetylserine efflux protein
MPDNLFALVSYVLISTFTPGPNNLTATSLGVVHGYRNSLPFQAGMALGMFAVFLASGWVSGWLLSVFPAVEPVLRLAGAVYILYLAVSLLKASYAFDEGGAKPVGFLGGMGLQLLNAKLLVYTLTLFATFLAPITGAPALLVLAAALLALVGFCAASTWALFGTAIKVYLRQPRVKTVINTALALLLVYTAVELSGLPELW